MAGQGVGRYGAGLAAILALPPAARAQVGRFDVAISSAPSPVGAGARATGVGSAFIALADDATAASWNPGGLTQLEKPELSIVGRGIYQTDTLSEGISALSDVDYTTTDGGEGDFGAASLNFASLAIPFTVADRVVVAAFNYQEMLSFDRDIRYRLETTSPGFFSYSDVHVAQGGSVSAITAALAGDLLPDLALGLAVNYWVDGLGHDYAWREKTESIGAYSFGDGQEYPSSLRTIDNFSHFRGVNGTVGVLWSVTQEIALGAVWKTPFTAHVDHWLRVLDTPDDHGPVQRHRIQMPASYGGGGRWRPTDELTLSADVTWVDWGQFRTVSSDGTEFLVTGDPASDHTVDGVFTERVGAEYLWVMDGYKLIGRGGLFHDPEPSRGSPRSFYGGSVGAGVTFPRLSVDFAYQLRAGLNAKNTSVATQLVNVDGVELDTWQHLFYLSIVQYF